MRFGVLISASVALGGLVAFVTPSGVVRNATVTAQAAAGQASQINLDDLNPPRAIYDREMAKVWQVQGPGSLGFKSSSVTFPLIARPSFR